MIGGQVYGGVVSGEGGGLAAPHVLLVVAARATRLLRACRLARPVLLLPHLVKAASKAGVKVQGRDAADGGEELGGRLEAGGRRLAQPLAPATVVGPASIATVVAGMLATSGCAEMSAASPLAFDCQLPRTKAPGTQWRVPPVMTHGVRSSGSKAAGPG